MKHALESKRLLRLATLLAVAAADATAQEERTARRIIISIPDRKLVLLESGRILKVYDVAVGAPSTPSPHGEFKIVSHAINPVWKNVPPGPTNPVGTRWLGLSIKGYGIHGTNAPGSIGKAASHGCIRMRNRDVEELFRLVPNGTSVELDANRPQILARLFAEPTPQSIKGE
jgi:L,D-transpeptidase ErfK/SrfK